MASDASKMIIAKEEEDEKSEPISDLNVANDVSSTMLSLLQEFRQRMDRLDALEESLQHRCRQVRRRVQLLLLQEPSDTAAVRRSHVRLSVHHSYQPEITAAGAMAALMQKPGLGGNPSAPCKPSPPIWTCHVEGKLLIDYLDYASAKRVDKNFGGESVGITKPLQFTHLFHKASVTFQTIFEHIDPKGGGGFKAKKKSRRTSNAMTDLPSEEPTDVCKSALHTIVWTLPNSNDPSSNTGADLWSFVYTEPSNPDKTKWKVQSVVAVLELHRRYHYGSGTSDAAAASESPRSYYRITSAALQKALFPHHGPVTTDVLTGVVLPTSSHAAILEHLLSSTHNQVHIPSVLTMTDIIMTFFTYIQDKRLILIDHGAGDVVQCDKTLQNLFHMEQFSFSQLRSLLQQRQLIEPASTPSIYDPVRITYLMDHDGASPSLVPSAHNTRAPKMTDTSAPPACLQMDMDIWVPTQFHTRIAALLQRCMPRETEAQAARAAARVRLSATLGTARRGGDDDPWVRSRIEQWLQRTEQGGVDAIPWIPRALAKSARPGSEAQRVYQCDALIDYWMQQLEHYQIPSSREASSAAQAFQQWSTSS